MSQHHVSSQFLLELFALTFLHAGDFDTVGAQYAEDSELLDFLNDAADSAAAICDLSDIGISDGRIELPTEQGKYNKQGDRAVDEDQHQTEGAVELAVVEEKAGILTRPDVVEEDHEQARSFRHTQDFSVDKSLNTDGFLFDPDEATVEGFDIDEVVGDGLIMGDEKYGHCYFTDFEDELPVITADENNDILIMEMAYQRLEYVVDPSTAHFRGQSAELLFTEFPDFKNINDFVQTPKSNFFFAALVQQLHLQMFSAQRIL